MKQDMLLLIDFVTDEVKEAAEIFRGGITGVDNEAGMLLRDLRPVRRLSVLPSLHRLEFPCDPRY